jgi:HEAT repeat protein
LKGLSLLGDEPAVFEALAAAESKLVKRECRDGEGDEGCDDLPKLTAQHQARIRGLARRAAAARECHGEQACWLKKLDDPDAGVRQRAALELGRSRQAAAVAPLLGHLSDPDPEARLAIIHAVGWLTHDLPAAREAAKAELPALARQLEADRGKSDWAAVGEDLRRLAVWLAR